MLFSAIAKSQRNGNPRRVPSPQVPDLITRSPGYNQPDRSSYGSIGTDESFPPPPSPLVQAKSRGKLWRFDGRETTAVVQHGHEVMLDVYSVKVKRL